jgi:hypothetical protein
MRKTAVLFTIFLPLSWAIFWNTSHSNKSGAPAGRTGSPGDAGKTCAVSGCHTGAAVTDQPGWITSDIPASGYIPGNTYNISATVSKAGISRFGFQLSPQNSIGTKLGTLISGTATQLVGSGKYITHTMAGTNATDSKTWTFQWIAPAVGSGTVTFYASFNAANNNNNASGDQVYTSSLSVQEDVTVSIENKEAEAKTWYIFPNPAKDIIRLYTYSNIQNGTVKIYDLKGALLYSVAEKIDINNGYSFSLPDKITSGMYILTIESNLGIESKKLVVEK